MDSTFDNFDFQAQTDIPSEINISERKELKEQKYRYERKTFDSKNRINKKNLIPSEDIWICGSRDKTLKRVKELEALKDKDGVVHIKLRDADLLGKIPALKQKLADFLNGHSQFPIGNTRNHKRCHFKVACEKGFDGDHGFSHAPSQWILWELFREIYEVSKRSQLQTQKDEVEEDDTWDTEQDSSADNGYYRHQHPKNLLFDVVVSPRANTSDEKLVKMFNETLPAFFAGHRSLPRIGKPDREQPIRWCQGPFCYRTLLALNSKDATTACKSCHSDETSLLTSIARVLVECRRAPRTTNATYRTESNVVREPRARVLRKYKSNTVSPVTKHNTFSALLDEEAWG
jgi:hypothetical protein